MASFYLWRSKYPVYIQKVISEKIKKKIIRRSQDPEPDPEPDPYQHVTDPEHGYQWIRIQNGQKQRKNKEFHTIKSCMFSLGVLPPSIMPNVFLSLSSPRFYQGFGSGSGSGLDPYSIGPVDPDPDSESGSGSRWSKMTHKSRKKLVKVHVLTFWMDSFESWRLLL